MLRTHLFAGLAALLILGVQPSARADDDDDWEDYQERIEQSRNESGKRYGHWRAEQDKRHQTWRDERGTDKDRVLELPDSGLKPGSYTVRLPFGQVRVNVPEDARAPEVRSAWGDRSYGDVYHRARQINGQLRELHAELQRAGQAESTADVAQIYEQMGAVVTAAAARKPAKEVQSAFAEFDRLWHPLGHRLTRQPDIGANVQRRVAVVNQLEDGLHQILAIAPAPPYDRPLVATLTSELAQTTSHLFEDLKDEPQRTVNSHAITLRAQRVKLLAADLDATVRQNAPFATVVEEYEEFDRAWHRLLEDARVSPEVDAHVRQLARQVRQIDAQLHEELYVNVPIVGDRQQLLHISAGISKTAHHLAEDLEAESGRDKRVLVHEAQVFAAVARDLNRTLSDRQTAEVEERDVKELVDSWRRLSEQIDALRGERFEHSRTVAARLGDDVQRLVAQWRG